MNPAGVLVDSNVLLDVMTEDPRWYPWSSAALGRAADEALLAINPIIYGEVSIRFETIEAAFLAGKCFLAYRKRGGRKTTPLPDFYIGAHAAIANLTLLTRDATRYKTYFPKLRLLAP
jgi:predicted nucleic acid-binding protein